MHYICICYHICTWYNIYIKSKHMKLYMYIYIYSYIYYQNYYTHTHTHTHTHIYIYMMLYVFLYICVFWCDWQTPLRPLLDTLYHHNIPSSSRKLAFSKAKWYNTYWLNKQISSTIRNKSVITEYKCYIYQDISENNFIYHISFFVFTVKRYM